jgi:hypothetical protein
MKNSKLKFSEYMQNISRSKSFGKFVLIVKYSNAPGLFNFPVKLDFLISHPCFEFDIRGVHKNVGFFKGGGVGNFSICFAMREGGVKENPTSEFRIGYF